MSETTKDSSFLVRLLGAIEKGGNKLPHPVMIFVYLIAIVAVGSFILSILNITVVDPRPEGAKGRTAEGLIYVNSLLTGEGLRYALVNAVPNFVKFAPLGVVLVSLIGVGIAERSGLIEATLKSLVKVTPKRLVTAVVVFAGVCSNLAGELGYVVFIPLGGIIFLGFKRHPIAGIAASFAGVSGGYSANLLLGTLDPLLAGLSTEAARIIDINYSVGIESNYYFLFVSTFAITLIGALVTDKIVEPMLGEYKGEGEAGKIEAKVEKTTDLEKKALRNTGLFSVFFVALLVVSVLPQAGGVLLNQETMSLSGSPFFKSIVAFVFLFFSCAGIVYGYTAKVYKSSFDVINAMTDAMKTMGGYIVLAFFMAQFINYFAYTNIGIILAVSLANFVQYVGLTGGGTVVALIFVSAFLNLFMGSASAKWSLLAPIFIPMFMLLGYSPEAVQLAYRIGDSSTNIITPLNSYIGIILLTAQRYRNETFGLGSLISVMLPYSVFFLLFWSVMFYLWTFVFGFPIGPGTPTHLNIG